MTAVLAMRGYPIAIVSSWQRSAFEYHVDGTPERDDSPDEISMQVDFLQTFNHQHGQSKTKPALAMSFNIPPVKDKRSFLATLRKMVVTVPERGKGRDTREHCEPYVLCHLLATLAKADRLDYPVSIKQRKPGEEPDFQILQGKKCIGVEVSEVIPNGYAHYVAVANKMEGRDTEGELRLLEPGHFRDDVVRTHGEVLQLLAQTRLTARPFYGDEPEQRWASFMASRIGVKLHKLKRYEMFDENWLALYDNLPFPDVNRRMATDTLRTSLSATWAAKLTFDAIIIESGAFIIKITPNDAEWLTINDIWTQHPTV